VADLPTGSNSAWNGEAALVWDNALGALRGSVARRTRFATMKDRFSYKSGTAIPNPDLKPETAIHYELACKGTPFRGWQVQGALFYSRITDLIQPVDAVAYVNNVWVSQTRNVGDARSMGYEVGLDAMPLPRLSVGGSFTHVDRKNLDAPEIRAVGIPWYAGTAYVGYTPIQLLELRAAIVGYGRRFATSTGVTLPPFATVELRGAVRLNAGVTFEAGVTNLLDAEYALDEGFPEPGRMYFTNLRFALSR
jgi:iron complex outermembrane recepter protein